MEAVVIAFMAMEILVTTEETEYPLAETGALVGVKDPIPNPHDLNTYIGRSGTSRTTTVELGCDKSRKTGERRGLVQVKLNKDSKFYSGETHKRIGTFPNGKNPTTRIQIAKQKTSNNRDKKFQIANIQKPGGGVTIEQHITEENPKPMILQILSPLHLSYHGSDAPKLDINLNSNRGNRSRSCILEKPRKLTNCINIHSNHGNTCLSVPMTSIWRQNSTGRVYKP